MRNLTFTFLISMCLEPADSASRCLAAFVPSPASFESALDRALQNIAYEDLRGRWEAE